MGSIVIGWQELLAAVLLVIVLFFLFSLLRVLVGRQSQSGRAMPATPESSQELARLREEVKALRGRLDAIEALISLPPPTLTPAEDTPYAQAVRLAREGLSPQELARRCGISRGEAELIVALNHNET